MPKLDYAICDEPLAIFLIAGDEKGLRAVWAGDSAPAMKAQLKRLFPTHTRVENPALARRILPEIYATLSGEKPLPQLPQHLPGTVFQKAVWKALLAIPHGQTATYTQIARAVGKPLAVRAVANACGANPLGVLVPCHRVLRHDGSLGGYHWGVKTKRRLLDYERKAATILQAVA